MKQEYDHLDFVTAKGRVRLLDLCEEKEDWCKWGFIMGLADGKKKHRPI